jgi:hypothetical protein
VSCRRFRRYNAPRCISPFCPQAAVIGGVTSDSQFVHADTSKPRVIARAVRPPVAIRFFTPSLPAVLPHWSTGSECRTAKPQSQP